MGPLDHYHNSIVYYAVYINFFPFPPKCRIYIVGVFVCLFIFCPDSGFIKVPSPVALVCFFNLFKS